ncbi:hypothetical protein QBC47DRAFT_361597 [Echria macrotheca]|uniref:MICOS complex subunit MIC12 n=1 Tax=Echria macrotheca TaxID=438768 RepID=A0AAJ0F5H7_9PEZI|nr:hypothetical protein QBC47DRAFT_361597 [Echria macrotheca]
MGFATGFTGGVTVTLGLTYLALAAHDRNRRTQSDILRAQTRVLNTLVPSSRSPTTPEEEEAILYPPSREELAARRRGHFIEAAKDRWNAEIEGAVRWAQTRDWAAARDDAEARVRDVAARVPVPAPPSVHMPDTDRLKEGVRGTASQIREDVAGVVGKTKELVGRAKAAVYLAEEKADSRLDAKLLHVSEIERALGERYEKDESVMKKGVEEVLAERYKPIEERDNSRLRGI